MSHMERNSMRAAYIHKAEHLDVNRLRRISLFDFAKLNASGLKRVSIRHALGMPYLVC